MWNLPIQEELQGSSSQLGYRSLWRRLKFHHNILVPRSVYSSAKYKLQSRVAGMLL